MLVFIELNEIRNSLAVSFLCVRCIMNWIHIRESLIKWEKVMMYSCKCKLIEREMKQNVIDFEICCCSHSIKQTFNDLNLCKLMRNLEKYGKFLIDFLIQCVFFKKYFSIAMPNHSTDMECKNEKKLIVSSVYIQ